MTDDPGTAPAKPKKTPLAIALLALGALAMVCVCGGVVAAVAVPAFINYVKRGKVAEATANLDVLTSAVRRSCASSGAYPPAAGPVPEAPTSGSQTPDFRAEPTFAQLGFDPGGAVYFSYAIEPTAEGVDLVAYGDLDGDGVRSERRVRCGAGCACGAPEVRDALE